MLCIYIRILCRTLIQTRSIIEEKMTQHFSKFYKDINTQIQEILQMPSRINTKKNNQESRGGGGVGVAETLAPVVTVIRGGLDEASPRRVRFVWFRFPRWHGGKMHPGFLSLPRCEAKGDGKRRGGLKAHQTSKQRDSRQQIVVKLLKSSSKEYNL